VGEVADQVPTPEAGQFIDEPHRGEGLILLDYFHENDFELEEISFLDSRLSARGYELVPFDGGDLGYELRRVDAFMVIAPLTTFSEEEIQSVSDFVDRGGRLLLVGDPTRFTVEFDDDFFDYNFSIDSDEIPLNSLANEFDLAYSGDYLYNTVESEGNFRNIMLSGDSLSESGLTEEIDKLAFYGAHSIQVGGSAQPILLGDDDTWSSATDRPGGLILAASASQDRVLAVGDIDFLSDPYHTVYDNSRFIANIADFLTSSEREYILSDFPFFFQKDVDLVYTGDPDLGPDAYDEIISLQNALSSAEKNLQLSDEHDEGKDTFFLGLFNQSEEVEEIIGQFGITFIIEPPITDEDEEIILEDDETVGDDDGEEPLDEEPLAEESDEEGDEALDEETEEDEEIIRRIDSALGSFQMSGTAIVLLHQEGDHRNVVVLASSSDGLENAVGRLVQLLSGDDGQALSDCILQADQAVCPTGIEDEAVEFKLETGGVPDVDAEEPLEDDDEVVDDEGPANGEEPDIDAVLQGTIGLDETVSGDMTDEQAHSWVFAQGPATINITLQVSENMDGVLEVYDPEGELLVFGDSGFTGEEERLVNVNIPTDGEYLIVVRDFFGDGGSYTLSVETFTLDLIGVSDQGELTAGEPVSTTLGAEEMHAWTFIVDRWWCRYFYWEKKTWMEFFLCMVPMTS
jgi:hypothetical protein